MSFFDLMQKPDSVLLETDDAGLKPCRAEGAQWNWGDVEITNTISGSSMHIAVYSKNTPVRRIRLRWNRHMESGMRFLGDHWERAYGDLEWRGLVPERVMPWYFLAHDGNLTHGYGVKTGCHAMCFWQVDHAGISLWLDVRSGGVGVRLGSRVLHAATVVTRCGKEGETPFEAAQEFCSMMCETPRLPLEPVYGGNNWYYAYGKSSHQEILEDSKFISSLSSSENRPYMVIDDGWQVCHSKVCNGGPWNQGNYLFPDMPRLAGEMRKEGVKPGIWLRPLLTAEKVPSCFVLTNTRFKKDVMYQFTNDQFLDPSVPGVLEKIAEDVRRIVSWDFELIKHDFSTCDIFGRWGFEMGSDLTNDGWSFADGTRTTAEIILELYRTIREAAPNAVLIGCNTVSHLSAGIFDIQRTGDDTSGLEWERTRKMGVNTLAFRMPQHNAFYASDADCVGLTDRIPWEFNKQWLALLANSGTPLFVSASPKAVGKEQEQAIKAAYEMASGRLPAGIPLDWMDTTCPQKWLLQGREVCFDWCGGLGVEFYR